MTARRSRRAGFTLVETLVALFVFAVVAVVAQRGMVTARVGLDRARSTLAAEQVARSIIETQLDALAPGPGELSGQTDGIAWTVTSEPILLPLPPAPPPAPTRGQQGAADPGATGGQNQGQAQGQGGDQNGGQSAQQQQEPDIRWLLLRVTVSVQNGRGRPLRIQTVHVAKDQS